ncbi:MAG: ExbD/TolR family protein [Longimicrobiales bacterium]
MSRRARAASPLAVRAEINVTSLVDVAFTLLIIFILTAPVLQGGVEVNVPEGRVGTVESSDDLIIVSVLADGSVLFGETPIPREGLEATLGQMIRAGGTGAVYVKADSLAQYGPVFQVISTVAAQEGVSLNLIGKEIPRG